MRTADFDYELPPELVAQEPAADRTGSRLLVYQRPGGFRRTCGFEQLPECLRAGDLLVVNRSRVIPARLHARKDGGTARVEVLLLEPATDRRWWVMLRPGKRVRIGATLSFGDGDGGSVMQARVLEKNVMGHGLLDFDTDPLAYAGRHGEMPLPPYIARVSTRDTDRERYQTVYAREPGSVAAPTAGLHFSRELLDTLSRRGVEIAEVTLHVGVGTFAPVKVERVGEHVMHAERYEVDEHASMAIERARAVGRRIIAVGTTSLRVLESVARLHDGRIVAGAGRTSIFIHPPAEFQVVDALITNFHLPRSTLLMLVSAFAAPGGTAGREGILAAYREAITRRFRFFSYGDAMLIE